MRQIRRGCQLIEICILGTQAPPTTSVAPDLPTTTSSVSDGKRPLTSKKKCTTPPLLVLYERCRSLNADNYFNAHTHKGMLHEFLQSFKTPFFPFYQFLGNLVITKDDANDAVAEHGRA